MGIEISPITVPVIKAMIKSTGNVKIRPISCIRIIATESCPMLCAIAPQILIVTIEILFVFFKIAITQKLKIPPIRLYQKEVNVPKSMEQRTILVIFIMNAEERFIANNIITTTRFARPNFALNSIPIGICIRVSIYPNIIASAVITPHKAM